MTVEASIKCQITIDAAHRKIAIDWEDGFSSNFHYVWLRHSARCTFGMSNDTAVKIDLLPDNPQSLILNKAWIEDELLKIEWEDIDNCTEHALTTLYHSAYDANSRRQRKHQPVLWDAHNSADLPVFDYGELNCDTSVLDLLIAVNDYGLARVRNVPIVENSIVNLAEFFGPVHVNNYGRVFDVRTQTNVNLGSNTGASLGPHTDEGYRHAPPGISLFHCLVASQQGGESVLVDGFSAAQKLKIKDPESFEVLTRIPVFYQRLALPDEDMQAHGRVIVTDIDNDVIGIRFTDRTIPPQDVPDEFVEPLYKALKQFRDIVNSEQMMFRYLMQPGDLHVFDNHRVLHGRTGFDGSVNRHLQQCSVNRDEYHNRLRVLASKQGHDVRQLVLSDGAMG